MFVARQSSHVLGRERVKTNRDHGAYLWSRPKYSSLGPNGDCRLSTTAISTPGKPCLTMVSTLLSTLAEMHSSPSLYLHSWSTYMASCAVCDLVDPRQQSQLLFSDSEWLINRWFRNGLFAGSTEGKLQGWGGELIWSVRRSQFPKERITRNRGGNRLFLASGNVSAIIEIAWLNWDVHYLSYCSWKVLNRISFCYRVLVLIRNP